MKHIVEAKIICIHAVMCLRWVLYLFFIINEINLFLVRVFSPFLVV